MLVLFTDYGWSDPYVGQVKAVLAQHAPGLPVIDLLHDVPDFNAHAGAHLLDALCHQLPPGGVFLCVVDPGVGGPRKGAVLEADGRWFVAPDNGLLSVVAARAGQCRFWRIEWQPEHPSNTFHGRDIFAPIAAAIASGKFPEDKLREIDSLEVAFTGDDLPRIIYIDHFGNAWTGIRASLMQQGSELEMKGRRLGQQRTFSDAAKGEVFWYGNSCGLVEVAANRASAAQMLELRVGDLVRLPVCPGSLAH